MPTFDIVCKTDLMEMDNAINGVNRETKQRFDLKGSKCEVQRQENLLTIVADDDMKLRQMQDLILNYAARRKIDMRSLDFQTPQDASGGSLRRCPVDRTRRRTQRCCPGQRGNRSHDRV